jgi:hypothetical protein
MFSMTQSDFIPYLASLAAFLMLIGFTFRNQLWLRTFAILSDLLFILYFLLSSATPIWTAIASTAAIIVINIYMMWKIVNEGRSFQLSAEEMMLYAKLPGLTPIEFKQLLAIAQWHNPQTPMQMTEEGTMPDALHYVLEGKVNSVGPHAFIGELAFLREKPATATTHAEPGALVVGWKQTALRSLMKSNDGIRKALDSLLTVDMAEKIARAAPPALQEQTA